MTGEDRRRPVQQTLEADSKHKVQTGATLVDSMGGTGVRKGPN